MGVCERGGTGVVGHGGDVRSYLNVGYTNGVDGAHR
jgi:hypothetical protein